MLSDIEILTHIQTPKEAPTNLLKNLTLRAKRGHKEASLNIAALDNVEYRIILRQANENPLDFSVIFAFCIPNTNQQFRLRRYNGKHMHTNRIERASFFDFHIHQATERYQLAGMREDAYAEPSDRFGDIHSALECLLVDCGFESPFTDQTSLFEGRHE